MYDDPLLVTVAAVESTLTLTKIFKFILDKALTRWAHNPPYNQISIEAGTLRWEFGCTLHPVPWEFIQVYFRAQDSAVKRGFASVYAREWWYKSKDKGRVCYAGMRIVPQAFKVQVPLPLDPGRRNATAEAAWLRD